jgi:hypothetical protein
VHRRIRWLGAHGVSFGILYGHQACHGADLST